MSTVITKVPDRIDLPEGIDEDVMLAYRYLQLKEERYTEEQCLPLFGYGHVSTLYAARRRWEISGSMEKARAMLLAPRVTAIQAAEQSVYAQWPELLSKVVDIVKTSKSDHVKMEAIDWLYQNVIKPVEDRITQPGDAEAEYAANVGDLDPTVIVLPKGLQEKRE